MSFASAPHIAHIMAGAAHGGAELFFERLCAAQHARGLAVKAFVRRNASREVRLAQSGVDSESLRFGKHFDIVTPRSLKRGLKNFGAEVVVAWMNRAAAAAPNGDWTLAGRLGGYYDLSNYRRCDVLIGNTRGLASWMVAEGWAQDKVWYLPNFALDLVKVLPERPGFLPGYVPFILAMGRLHPNKGFDVLIEAMAQIPRAHLVIAGEGPSRDALRQLARKVNVSDRVHMPGWISNNAPWLRACDVFVCSSRIEPLGNIVIEAMSASRPVVAGAIQGPKEVLSGTSDGVLAESENPQDFARKIVDLLDDPVKAERIAENGRRRYQDEFCPETVLQQWDAFIQQVRRR